MIIKTFLVKNLEEAEQQINQELGPHAVILTSRQIRPKGFAAFFSSNRFEVTAAVEEKEWETYQLLKEGSTFTSSYPPIQKSPYRQAENTRENPPAASEESMENLKEFRKLLRDASPEPKETDEEEENFLNVVASQDDSYESLPFAGTYKDARFNRQIFAENKLSNDMNPFQEEVNHQNSPPLATPPLPKQKLNPETLFSISEKLISKFGKSSESASSKEFIDKVVFSEATLRKLIREEMERCHAISNTHLFDESYLKIGSFYFLLSKGIAYSIAKDIEEKLDVQFGKTDMSIPSPERSARLNELKKELSSRIKTAGPLTLTKEHPTCIAIVGSPGVGKTMTAVKIGWQYQNELNKQVAIISLDQHKTGSREHIHALVEKYSIPLAYASTTHELQEAIHNFQKSVDLIIIDTAGRNIYQEQHLDELADIFSTVDNLQVHLAINAMTKDVDVYGSIQRFSRLNVETLIFTKLDETISHGILINACVKTQKPISYLTTGQSIPDDLKIADPDEIARSFLIQNNAQEFAILREMALQ